MKQLDALRVVEAEGLQAGPHGRVEDLGNRSDRLDMGPDDAMTDAEKGGRKPVPI